MSKHKTAPKVTVTKQQGNAATLLDIVKQIAATLLLLILGAGSWYYFNNQLEPFPLISYGMVMK